MTMVQRQYYDNIMFTEIDRIATMDFAIKQAAEKGREEGMEKGREEVALNLLRMNVPLETISKSTGLSEEAILSLSK